VFLKISFFSLRELDDEVLKKFSTLKLNVVWMRFNPTHAMSLNTIISEEVTESGIMGKRHHFGQEENFNFPFHVEQYVVHSEQWMSIFVNQEMSEVFGYDMVSNYPMDEDLRLEERKLTQLKGIIEGLRVIEMPAFPYSPIGRGGKVDRRIKDQMVSPCSRMLVKVLGDCYTRNRVRLKDGEIIHKERRIPLNTPGVFFFLW